MNGAVRRALWAAFFCVLQILAACSGGPGRRATKEALLSAPSRKLSNYPATLSLPLEQRIGRTPQVFLDNLRTMDNDPSYTDYSLTAEQWDLVVRYLGLLPPRVHQVLEERLIGLYFVAGFRGTGLADWVLDEGGHIFVAMAFNPASLTADLSRWMTARERTAFQGDAAVTVDCGTGYTGFLYGILHETAHAVDYVDRITPYTEPALLTAGVLPPAAYDPVFTTAVWQDYRAPLAEYDTPLRSRIGFYGLPGPARLEFRDAAGLYAWLDGSPFVSLYASQSWAEDLAEAVAWYHYVTVMGGTYTLLVPNGGGGQRALSPAAKIAARAGWKSVLEHMYAD